MTDFAAMGLAHCDRGQNAFTACVPRGTVERPTRMPRKSQSMTPAQKTLHAPGSFEDRQALATKAKRGQVSP